MTDLSAFRAHWTEKRPQPLELTDTERLDFLGERGRYRYVDPTPTEIGYHEIIDVLGNRTTAANFRDAIDEAAAKWKEANGG